MFPTITVCKCMAWIKFDGNDLIIYQRTLPPEPIFSIEGGNSNYFNRRVKFIAVQEAQLLNLQSLMLLINFN